MTNEFQVSKIEGLPDGWKTKKISVFADVTSGGTPNTKIKEYWDGDILWMNSGEINHKKVLSVEGRITKAGLMNSSTKILPVNSILIALAGQGTTRGKVAINKVELCTNQSLAAISNLKEVDYQFLYYNLENRYSELRQLSTGDGGRGGLNLSIIKSIEVNLPPLYEQKKISEILSTIDSKIEYIKSQIHAIHELKNGLVQFILSKGIGHTKYKKSEIGEIPEIWKVVKLSQLAKCFVGIASSATHAYTTKGVLLIRNQNIKEGWLDLNDKLFVTEDYELQHKSKRLKGGDILTVRTGYPGISSVVPETLANSQSFTTLITRITTDSIISDFLCYYINSEKGKSFFQNNQAGGGQQNVGSKTLENLLVPVAPLNEQLQIVNILKTVDNKLDLLKNKKENYEELKTGLVQQLLTGKIRVNAYQQQSAVA